MAQGIGLSRNPALIRAREIYDAGLTHDQLSPRNIFVLASGGVEIDAFPQPTASGATLVSEPKLPQCVTSCERITRI